MATGRVRNVACRAVVTDTLVHMHMVTDKPRHASGIGGTLLLGQLHKTTSWPE